MKTFSFREIAPWGCIKTNFWDAELVEATVDYQLLDHFDKFYTELAEVLNVPQFYHF